MPRERVGATLRAPNGVPFRDGSTAPRLERNIHHQPQGRVEGLVSEPVGGELVVYDTASNTAHSLAAEAAAVWERCDGTRSCAQIARELGMENDLVDRVVEGFERLGLLQQPFKALPRYSRREAGAMLGKAVLLAPLIYSAAIPASAAAASPAPVACFAGPPTNMPTGGPAANGSFGYSSQCPLSSGNTFNTNCYVTLTGTRVCGGAGQCLPAFSGCPGPGITCCAGASFCVNNACTR